jgi:hypothetical protein
MKIFIQNTRGKEQTAFRHLSGVFFQHSAGTFLKKAKGPRQIQRGQNFKNY